jgi:hypothetical protein
MSNHIAHHSLILCCTHLAFDWSSCLSRARHDSFSAKWFEQPPAGQQAGTGLCHMKRRRSSPSAGHRAAGTASADAAPLPAGPSSLAEAFSWPQRVYESLLMTADDAQDCVFECHITTHGIRLVLILVACSLVSIVTHCGCLANICVHIIGVQSTHTCHLAFLCVCVWCVFHRITIGV